VKGFKMLDTYNTSEEYRSYDINDLSLFDFPIKETALFVESYGNYTSVPDKKAIVRSDTGQFLGFHSNRYKTINHYNLFKKHSRAVTEKGFNNNIQIKDSIWNYGAKAHRSILFKDHKVNIVENDPMYLKIDVFNSLDGSTSFISFVGGYRSVCQNGQVFGGEKISHQKQKHTKGLNINSAVGKLDTAVDTFVNNGDKLKQWSNSYITDDNVIYLLANTICRKESKTSQVLTGSDRVNQRLSDFFFYLYEKEQACGSEKTLWALYNSLTYWSTHVDDTYELENNKGKLIKYSLSRKNSNVNNLQFTRMGKVSDVLNSNEWKSLEVA
jgi:hypothetical protein